jgi:hypothetical protein
MNEKEMKMFCDKAEFFAKYIQKCEFCGQNAQGCRCHDHTMPDHTHYSPINIKEDSK